MSFKYDALEIARIIGEPMDPRRPYPLLVDKLCEVDYAMPDEYVYDFDVLMDTDTIYTITSTGAVTTVNVSPDTPTILTFVDVASPEYYVKLIDLAKAKERTLGRKKRTIERALNAEENYQVIQLLDAAAIARGNLNDLRSGEDHFTYEHLVEMIDEVIDYSQNYVLVAGTTIDRDIKLWDFKDNKYTSLKTAFEDLGVEVVRINQTVTRDGSSTPLLAATTCYLAGTLTEAPGKPLLFVRKRLDAVEKIGGMISMDGEQPQRLVFVSPNPVMVSSTRYLAVAITGFEEWNLHALFISNNKVINLAISVELLSLYNEDNTEERPLYQFNLN